MIKNIKNMIKNQTVARENFYVSTNINDQLQQQQQQPIQSNLQHSLDKLRNPQHEPQDQHESSQHQQTMHRRIYDKDDCVAENESGLHTLEWEKLTARSSSVSQHASALTTRTGTDIHQKNIHQTDISQNNIHENNIHETNIHQNNTHQDNIPQNNIHQNNIHQNNFHQNNINQKQSPNVLIASGNQIQHVHTLDSVSTAPQTHSNTKSISEDRQSSHVIKNTPVISNVQKLKQIHSTLIEQASSPPNPKNTTLNMNSNHKESLIQSLLIKSKNESGRMQNSRFTPKHTPGNQAVAMFENRVQSSNNNSNPSNWSITDVGSWLEQHASLSNFKTVFEHHKIDGSRLLELDEVTLHLLGLSSKQVSNVMKELTALKQYQEVATMH